MATSLASQLQRLAGPQTDALDRNRGLKRASLLFDPSEAAKYDFSDIHAIGLGGLQELELLHPSFARFEQSLFSDVSQSIERSVQSAELNQKLDAEIREFLKHVAPYILLRPAIKSLEWLIVRYHIHQYNLEDVMLAFIPYHETNIFVRMVQLLEYKTNSRWAWLAGIQKKGVPLTKKDLLKFMRKQNWILGYFCDAVISSAENSKLGKSSPSNDIFLKFFASTVITFLHTSDSLDNEVISVVLPAASKCIRSSDADYRATGYSMLASVARLTKLTSDTITAFASALSRSSVDFSDESGVKALSIVLTSVTEDDLPGNVIDVLGDAKLLSFAIRCMEKHGMHELFWLLLKSAFNRLLKVRSESVGNVLLAFLASEKLLESVRESDQMTKATDYFVERLLKQKHNASQISSDPILCKIFGKIRNMDPQTWTELLNSRGRERDRLLESLDAVLSEQAGDQIRPDFPAQTGLFLKLNHPNAVLRTAAITELMNGDWAAFGREFVKDIISARLKDRDPEIVAKILQSPDVLKKVFGEDLKTILRELLLTVRQPAKGESQLTWMDVEVHALIVLGTICTVEKVVPFFLTAALRRNAGLSKISSMVDIFPLTTSQNLSELSSRQLCDLLSTDLVSLQPEIIVRVIDALLQMTDSPNPAVDSKTTVIWTLHNLIGNISTHRLFFQTPALTAVYDLLIKILPKMRFTNSGISKDPMERFVQFLIKGKLPVEMVVHWFDRLWKVNVGKEVDRKILLRTAEFVFNDLAGVGAKAVMQKGSTFVLASQVLRDVSTIRLLLVALADQSTQSPSLTRNILKLSASTLSLIGKEKTSDEVAGDIIIALLPLCASEDPIIRTAAADNFVQWVEKHSFKSKDVEKLVEIIAENKDQIQVDAAASNKILADAFKNPKLSTKIQNFWLDLLLKPISQATFSPLMMARLLRSIRSVVPAKIICRLIPLAKSVIEKYSSATAMDVQMLNEFFERDVAALSDAENLLSAEEQRVVLELVLQGLKLGRVGRGESPAEVILRQMFLLSRENVGVERFDLTMKQLILIYLDKSNPSSSELTYKYLKHVRIPSAIIIDLLYNASAEKDQKSKRSSHGLARLNDPKLQTVDFWTRCASVLEIVQSKKKILEINALIKELFRFAKETVVVDSKPELQEAVEKVRQLIFSTLNFHCRRLGADILTEKEIDVPAIVECIRCSLDNQTYLTALVLLSTLAEIIPANVIQNCMTIFTLTGSKLMVKEDHYSAEVIGRTIDVIVPVMMKASPSTQHNAVREVMELFIDALPHLPAQRREFLFKRLLKVARGSENLWILTVLLMNVYVVKSLPMDETDTIKRKSYPVLSEFLKQLYEDISLDAVIHNLVNSATVIVDASFGQKAVNGNVAKSKKPRTPTSNFDKPLINTGFTTEENVRMLSSLLNFISVILASESLQKEQLAAFSNLDQSLEALFAKLLSIQAQISTQNKNKAAWLDLSPMASGALSEVLGKMSWESFVRVVLEILQEPDAAPLKTSLEQLGGTLSIRAGFAPHDSAKLVPLLDALVGIAEKFGEKSSDRAAVRRGSLYCLKELVRLLGKDTSKSWAGVVDVSVKCLASPDISICAEALNVLTVVVSTLKTALLPRLPQLLPKLLDCIWNIFRQDRPESIAVLAASDALEVLVLNLSAFVSPQLPTVLLILAQCSIKTVRESVRESFARKLDKIRHVLCEKVVFRVFLSAFAEANARVERESNMPKGLQVPLFGIFNASLKVAKTADILSMQRELVEMLFGIFEKRGENLDEAIRALSMVAVRMPESAFKSKLTLQNHLFDPLPVYLVGLFMRVYQWAIQDTSSKSRLLTFYSIVNSLTDSLKHLFTLFAPTTITHAITTMNLLHILKSTDRKDTDSNERTALLVLILSALHKFFKYDSTEYFNSDQCGILMQPLIDQLENYEDRESYSVLLPPLIGAIAAFVSCLNDDSLWKPLHYQVCLKTRSEEPEVRIGALKCIETLAAAMGDGYAGLFPEAVTFLVELSTDDDDRVEEQCLRTKETIERVMGDSTIWKTYAD